MYIFTRFQTLSSVLPCVSPRPGHPTTNLIPTNTLSSAKHPTRSALICLSIPPSAYVTIESLLDGFSQGVNVSLVTGVFLDENTLAGGTLISRGCDVEGSRGVWGTNEAVWWWRMRGFSGDEVSGPSTGVTGADCRYLSRSGGRAFRPFALPSLEGLLGVQVLPEHSGCLSPVLKSQE